VCKVIGYEGNLVFDSSKPDGTPRKLLDTAFLDRLGWRSKIDLESGLKDAYQWFLQNRA
jgi:GDP-L-fucose synthase